MLRYYLASGRYYVNNKLMSSVPGGLIIDFILIKINPKTHMSKLILKSQFIVTNWNKQINNNEESKYPGKNQLRK